MTHDDWLIFLGTLQIDLKRQLMTLDTLISEDNLRNPPLLADLPFEEREVEIERRHKRQANYHGDPKKGWTDAQGTQRSEDRS